MNEKLLVDFFNKKVTIDHLANQLHGTQTKMGHGSTRINFAIMEDGEDYEVKKEHLLRLCDAFLKGKIDAEALNAIALALQFSDFAEWDYYINDGHIISDIIHAWASPEIHYPLTTDNINLFKNYLETGIDPFGK